MLEGKSPTVTAALLPRMVLSSGHLRTEKCPELAPQFFRVLHLAFPHGKDAPAKPLQRTSVCPIAPLIASQFRPPISLTRLRNMPALAAMGVPETAVHVDHLAARWEYEIGRSGQTGHVQPIPESQCIDNAAHDHLRLGMLRPDRGHTGTSLRL
jgi:hypothetical protein